MEEEYRAIENYDKYEVSNVGNVRNKKTGRVLKPGTNEKGYHTVSLSDENKTLKTLRIHRLVAETFLENLQNKPVIDHIDSNKLNNNVTNLRYATLSENGMNKQINSNNTSGVKGVRYENKKWRATIEIDGVKIHIGYYNTMEEAKQARINRANQAFGEFVNACERL